MNSATTVKRAFEAGTFPDLLSADRAVEQLLSAGFLKEEITVLCADEVIESHFRQQQIQRPPNSDAPHEAMGGATFGAAVGGLAAIAIGAAGGSVPLIIAAVAGISGGSALGGFLGSIIGDNCLNETVRQFDQEIRSGQILVVAEDHDSQVEAKLARAAVILAKPANAPKTME